MLFVVGEEDLPSEEQPWPTVLGRPGGHRALRRHPPSPRHHSLLPPRRRYSCGGLTLKATDTAWSTSSGPEVSGPALSLLLAMTGRKAALEDLSGDGVAMLAARP